MPEGNLINSIDEIKKLEDRLRDAELGPHPEFFEEILDDDFLFDGERAKAQIVEAHRPGKGQRFSEVVMSDFEYIDHGAVVVVKCVGHYKSPQWEGSLKFMRVWFKRDGRWKVIAGSILK